MVGRKKHSRLSDTEYSLLFAAGKGKPYMHHIDKNGKLYYLGNVTLYEADKSSDIVELINDVSERK